MKVIEPVQVWFNGAEREATFLSVICTNDNLSVSASFNYQLIGMYQYGDDPTVVSQTPFVNGSLLMTGQNYQDWQTNEYAYDWVAQQLNLTIISDYTTTTTTTTTSSTTSTTTIAPPSTTSTTTTSTTI